MKERKGTKKKTKRVKTLFFSSEDEEDPTSLPYYYEKGKGGIIHKIRFSNVYY